MGLKESSVSKIEKSRWNDPEKLSIEMEKIKAKF
jgi:hypothetical protein